MKRIIFFSSAFVCMFCLAATARAQNVRARNVALDFSLTSQLPPVGEIFYGWQLFPWGDWLARSSSGPLMLPIPANHPPLEIFEARAAGVVVSPATKFTKGYLQNIDTINRLDPDNAHHLLSAPNAPLVIETIVTFPSEWSRLIAAGKATKLLDGKADDSLQMVSAFRFVDAADIAGNPKLQQIVHSLDVTGRAPQAVSIQGIIKINQIALFGTIVTLFYQIDSSHTLVVSDFALAIKKKELDLGFDMGNVSFKGRSVLLGQNSVLNTNSGIGAGLPRFAEELFANTYMGLQQ